MVIYNQLWGDDQSAATFYWQIRKLEENLEDFQTYHIIYYIKKTVKKIVTELRMKFYDIVKRMPRAKHYCIFLHILL